MIKRFFNWFKSWACTPFVFDSDLTNFKADMSDAWFNDFFNKTK